jgi:gliding motility associated protien GldN
MNKITFVFIVLLSSFFLGNNSINAQVSNVLDGVYVKKHVQDRRPVPFQYLREADVMWSKTIWRRIDLREKMNLSLYFPKKPMEQNDRMSLIDLIIWAIKTQSLTAYIEGGISGTDEFGKTITLKEIQEDKFDAKETEKLVEDVNTGQKTMKKVAGDFNTFEVKQYLVKELWFFDKQRSVMEVRIIGICPVREYFKDQDADHEDPQYKKVCWIYYPEVRKFLAQKGVFNTTNDHERRTFDDIFIKRMFSSFIYQESNQYDNRPIEEYAIGMETLLESDRIKETIFNFEQDLWEY